MKIASIAATLMLAFTSITTFAGEFLTIQLKDGPVVIELYPQIAPQSVMQIKTLAKSGQYNQVAFHRVIDGFMAQTGDVKFGNMKMGYDPENVGTGGSDLSDLPAEFSSMSFERGVVAMARASNPNSGNSQFFITFAPSYFLNGQYTVVGKVISGMEAVDKIKRGVEAEGGAVSEPDRMLSVTFSYQ